MSDNQNPIKERAAARKTVRRMFLFTLLTAGIGFAVYDFVLLPIYWWFGNDVVYQDSWWVWLLYFLTREGVCDMVIFTLAYIATLYTIWRAGFVRALRVILLYAGLTAVAQIGYFIMNAVIMEGALPGMDNFLAEDLPIILLQYGLELGQYLLAVLIFVLVKWRYDDRVRVAEGMKLLPASKQIDYPAPPPAFPFLKLVSFRNPLQSSALYMTLLVFVLRVANYSINAVTEYMYNGDTLGWGERLIDLASHIILAVLMYFGSILLLMHFHSRESKKG